MCFRGRSSRGTCYGLGQMCDMDPASVDLPGLALFLLAFCPVHPAAFVCLDSQRHLLSSQSPRAPLWSLLPV